MKSIFTVFIMTSIAAAIAIGDWRFLIPAYDAGSEADNELCAYRPGPPCGSVGVRATEGVEGFVHIHAGIHGGGDLNPATYDWRNPVAKVSIQRIGAPVSHEHSEVASGPQTQTEPEEPALPPPSVVPEQPTILRERFL